MFDCTFTNRVMFTTCSFDGGEPEMCSFPLKVSSITFGLDFHTIEVTAYDVFGLNMTFSLYFSLVDREFSCGHIHSQVFLK